MQKTKIFTTILLSLSLCGCGEKLPADLPRLYPASITVTQGGEPLADAAVSLTPVDTSSRWGAGGTTNASGVAVLRTQGTYNGVALGEYKVSVIKTLEEPSQFAQPDLSDQRAYEQWSRDIQGERRQSFTLVDPAFSSHADTPATVEVVAGRNAFSVDVGDAVQIPIQQR